MKVNLTSRFKRGSIHRIAGNFRARIKSWYRSEELRQLFHLLSIELKPKLVLPIIIIFDCFLEYVFRKW
jgi:hypothetical protein